MGKRNRAIVGLLLDTGIRRAEATNLTIADVDLDDQLVVVTGKGAIQRHVPFSMAVEQLLKDWIVAWGESEGSLFGLTDQGIRQLFRRIQIEIGIKNFYPHACRHSAATSMVRWLHHDRIMGHIRLLIVHPSAGRGRVPGRVWRYLPRWTTVRRVSGGPSPVVMR